MATTCPDDELEPNDDQASATPYESADFPHYYRGSPGSAICPGNDDYFSYEHPGGTLDVDLYFEHALGDLDLYLYGPGGAEIGSSYTSDDDEHLTGSYAAGTYIVRVDGFQGATTPLYNLSVTSSP